MKKGYLQHKPPVRLLITFLLNCCMWLVLDTLMQLVWQDEDGRRPWYTILSKAVFMGIWWTIFFSGPLIRTVFGKQKKQSHEPGSGTAA